VRGDARKGNPWVLRISVYRKNLLEVWMGNLGGGERSCESSSLKREPTILRKREDPEATTKERER